MKLVYLLSTLFLCTSCTTKKHLNINDSVFNFKYCPVNTKGGMHIVNYALEARDILVDDVKSLSPNVSKIELNSASISYSLSGYYTFLLTGEIETESFISKNLVLIDKTDLINEAIKRKYKNMVSGMVIFPSFTTIQLINLVDYKTKYLFQETISN